MKKIMKWNLITLLAAFILVVLTGMYKFNWLASQEGYDCDGNKIETAVEIAKAQSGNLGMTGQLHKDSKRYEFNCALNKDITVLK